MARKSLAIETKDYDNYILITEADAKFIISMVNACYDLVGNHHPLSRYPAGAMVQRLNQQLTENQNKKAEVPT